MRSPLPSQLGLFDAPGEGRGEQPARPERPDWSEPPPRAEPRGQTEPRPASRAEVPPRSDPASSHRLPAREEALPRAAELAHRLSVDLGVPVHLRLTDNRATLVSFRRGPHGLRLRVHHLFLDAPDAVVTALADYAGRGRAESREALESYAHDHQELVRRERLPGHGPRSRGRCFDLHAILTRLNATHFEGRVTVHAGWARRPSGKKRLSIHLGGYDARLREIRIHPALDKPHVPAFVVEYLVFHAMLHADLAEAPGPDSTESTHCAPEHTPLFLEREATFPLRDAAQRWLRDHHAALLRG